MKKICANPECEQSGIKQPPENFYKGRRICKSCTKKVDAGKASAKYKERKEFLKLFAV